MERLELLWACSGEKRSRHRVDAISKWGLLITNDVASHILMRRNVGSSLHMLIHHSIQLQFKTRQDTLRAIFTLHFPFSSFLLSSLSTPPPPTLKAAKVIKRHIPMPNPYPNANFHTIVSNNLHDRFHKSCSVMAEKEIHS